MRWDSDFGDALADLERRHAAEEREEALPDCVERPRLLHRVSGNGELSEAWLRRLAMRMVADKKPLVVDHLRSFGAWLASIDEPPRVLLDGMSQTATLPAGLAPDAVVRAYFEDALCDTVLSCLDRGASYGRAVKRFSSALQHLTGLAHVTFVNSGAESVEKALALCRLRHRERRRVIAFEGSFHGRTLLALSASYNPAKRAPFEFAGYEAVFAPFPVCPPQAVATTANEDVLRTFHAGGLDALQALGADPLWVAELDALRKVEFHLREETAFAVIVEPMQSEGGDRYATARFFRLLRLLTRRYDVPLVFDEVQTGFGLGGSFLWHDRFALVDPSGRPEHPDCVCFAKRAQVGIVASRFEDPEPTSAHGASLVRGWLHAQLAMQDARVDSIAQRVHARLGELAHRYPQLVLAPRVTGYALAFDVPSPVHLQAYLAQRMPLGVMVFAAGERTVRYRLSQAYGEPELEALFDAIERSLDWIESHPEGRPTIEESPGIRSVETGEAFGVTVRVARPDEADRWIESIVALEAQVYEPERRDPVERLRLAFEDSGGVAVIAELSEGSDSQLAGYALGAPLEYFGDVAGPREDPSFGRHDTLYSCALTVAPPYRGRGIGRALKRAQLEEAKRKTRPEGAAYRAVSGRNRVGFSDRMTRINRTFGAYEVEVYDHQYGGEGRALYYRIPLGAPAPVVPAHASEVDASHDLASGLAAPLSEPPATLRAHYEEGRLYGPAVSKLTVSNYVTRAIVRAVEWIGALSPGLPRLYLTSSRDEAFDKAVRILQWHRGKAPLLIGLEGGYVGHTTAAARSLSDPAVHRQGPAYFDHWARVPHPSRVGSAAVLDCVRALVRDAGGAANVLGFVVEPVQERTGQVIADDFWTGLAAVRQELGIPVVAVETSTACHRSGHGPFFLSNQDFVPDLVCWWGGGQIGFVHTTEAMFVDKPLVMVSTWDGDELSLLRVHHQLRAARTMDIARSGERLEQALDPVVQRGARLGGVGLYRTLGPDAVSERMTAALEFSGFRVRRFPNGVAALIPPLDVPAEAFASLTACAREVADARA